MVEEKVLVSDDGKKFSKHQFMMMTGLLKKFCENFCPNIYKMGCNCPFTTSFRVLQQAQKPAQSASPVSRGRKPSGGVIHPDRTGGRRGEV